jgi:hypothetical protein
MKITTILVAYAAAVAPTTLAAASRSLFSGDYQACLSPDGTFPDSEVVCFHECPPVLSSYNACVNNCLAGCEEPFAVVSTEPLWRGALPASAYSRVLNSEDSTDILTTLNPLASEQEGIDSQQAFYEKVLGTPQGQTFAFDDVKTLAVQMFTETQFVRYLETSDDGESYKAVCGSNSANAVVTTLFNNDLLISDTVPVPTRPNGAEITLGRDADGNLMVTDETSEEDTSRVLGCLFFAEEIYHAALHFLEGNFQGSVDTGVITDPFLYDLLNIEGGSIDQTYAKVRPLTLTPDLIFKGGLPTWFTEDIIIPTIAGALEDFTSLNPLANIPESRLEDFDIPLHHIFENILATDFGYGSDSYEIYVSADTTVTAPKNNLAQLQLMVANLHTDTFVFQQVTALQGPEIMNSDGAVFRNEFATFFQKPLTYYIVDVVSFPPAGVCLSSPQDASFAYNGIASSTYEEGSPSEVAQAALETYVNWLDGYRSSGLTGIAAAYADNACMSSSTWI